ncbi:hypothetical protein P7K49_002263, partial [Saguinus oedipus]
MKNRLSTPHPQRLITVHPHRLRMAHPQGLSTFPLHGLSTAHMHGLAQFLGPLGQHSYSPCSCLGLPPCDSAYSFPTRSIHNKNRIMPQSSQGP